MLESSSVKGLASEAVQGASLPLESIDHIHGCHRLSLSVLSVGDCVSDDVLQEHLEDTASLLVDETADALHSTPAGKTADSGLGDALDVVTKDLPVTLRASLAETLASFATSSHCLLGSFADQTLKLSLNRCRNEEESTIYAMVSGPKCTNDVIIGPRCTRGDVKIGPACTDTLYLFLRNHEALDKRGD